MSGRSRRTALCPVSVSMPKEAYWTFGNSTLILCAGLMVLGAAKPVYDGQGDLVTDYLNGCTYKYASPYENHGYDHLMLDVLPYLLWGNGPIVVNREPIVVRP